MSKKLKPPRSEYKAKFRATKQWINFSRKMRAERKVDAITGSKLTKRSHLHHLNEAEYERLEPELFITLNSQSHSTLEQLFRKKNWREVLANYAKYLELMEHYKQQAQSSSADND